MKLEEKLNEGVEGSANIKKVYNFLNNKYFNSALPKIKIGWSGKMKRAIGTAHVSYKSIGRGLVNEIDKSSLEIKIATNVDMTLRDLQAILLHEMVHMALFLQNNIGGHHGSPEFDGWITELRKQSTLDVPYLESKYKLSPKVAAKEGLIIIIKTYNGEYGFNIYSKPFMQKNWMKFMEMVNRVIQYSSKVTEVEMYKSVHPIVSTNIAIRNLKGLKWKITDDNTVKEIRKNGTKFMELDRNKGWIDPKKAGLQTETRKTGKWKIDNNGNWS